MIFISHLHPGPIWPHSGLEICFSPPSLSHLSFTQVPRFSSLLHPSHMSPPPKSGYSCLTSIQATKIASQLHSSHNLSVSQDMRLTPTQLLSHTTQVSRCESYLNPGPTQHPPRSRDLRLTFILVPSHVHLGPNIGVSPSSRSRLTSIQFPWIAYHSSSQFSHFHPGREFCVSPPSMSHLTSIQGPDSI